MRRVGDEIVAHILSRENRCLKNDLNKKNLKRGQRCIRQITSGSSIKVRVLCTNAPVKKCVLLNKIAFMRTWSSSYIQEAALELRGPSHARKLFSHSIFHVTLYVTTTGSRQHCRYILVGLSGTISLIKTGRQVSRQSPVWSSLAEQMLREHASVFVGGSFTAHMLPIWKIISRCLRT